MDLKDGKVKKGGKIAKAWEELLMVNGWDKETQC